MNQKVIIVRSMNLTPEDELEEKLNELGEGWRVVSATTAAALQGTMDIDAPGKFFGVARHIYFVTTAVVEKTT